jgi:gas vesicle protein
MADGEPTPTPGGGWVPVPDPTALTAGLVNAAKDDLRRELASTVTLLSERIAALDRLLAGALAERDERVVLAAAEARSSLASALAAQKEAVFEQQKANSEAAQKAEIGTQKQIDALTQLMSTSLKALEDKVADIKERLDRGDPTVHSDIASLVTSRDLAQGGSQWGQRATAIVLAAVAAFGASIAVIVSIVHP